MQSLLQCTLFLASCLVTSVSVNTFGELDNLCFTFKTACSITLIHLACRSASSSDNPKGSSSSSSSWFPSDWLNVAIATDHIRELLHRSLNDSTLGGTFIFSNGLYLPVQ